MADFPALPGAPNSSSTRFTSTEELEAEVGTQFRRARLAQGLTQIELAERAGVGKTSIKDLESGQGSSLKTIVRVARVLDLIDNWLLSLAPEPQLSPLEVLRRRGMLKAPKRAPSRRTKER